MPVPLQAFSQIFEINLGRRASRARSPQYNLYARELFTPKIKVGVFFGISLSNMRMLVTWPIKVVQTGMSISGPDRSVDDIGLVGFPRRGAGQASRATYVTPYSRARVAG
jgi:hypothetical protein